MSRPKTNIYELDGTRLRNAIKAKGYTYREFAELVTGKTGKAASDWISQLCLEHGNRNKLAVNARMLKLMSNTLDVLPEYLTGESDLATPVDLEKEEQRQIQKDYRYAKSECDSFLLPVIEMAGFTRSGIGWLEDRPMAMFEDSRRQTHAILAEDLRKMEKLTIDLIQSMLSTMNQNQPH